MSIVEIDNPQSELAKLVERVTSGEEVIIAKEGKPVVRIVRCDTPLGPRRPPVGNPLGIKIVDEPAAEVHASSTGAPRTAGLRPAPGSIPFDLKIIGNFSDMDEEIAESFYSGRLFPDHEGPTR